MQCEKVIVLQATSDADYLIADSFLIDGQLTDLYLYPTQLRLMQKNKNTTIPFQFSLHFSIIQNENGQAAGLEFYCGEEKIKLERDFWPRAQQWENLLMGCVTRKDFHQFFKPIRKIGKGNFATVYLAEDIKASRPVAIKAFMKDSAYRGDGKAAIQNEVKIMRKLKNPNIVSLYGVYQTRNSLYLSMEYIEGHTLQNFLKRNKEITIEQRKKIMKGLLNGLKQLSNQRVVHRDIKPENIIISDNCEKVKIVDFGLATFIDQPTYIFVRCGTPGFVAPQILKIKEVETARLGVESDMFSLGAIYYSLIYGYSLFPGKNQNQVLNLNRQCRIKLVPKENLGYGELQLLFNMLQLDPKCRITPEQALKSLVFQQKKDIFCRALQPITNDPAANWIFEDK